MANEVEHEAVATHDDHHHEVVPNPDYDGPANHCLPPPVENRVGSAIYFVVLMLLLAWGAVWLGSHIL